jgi:hypothetical protein
MRQRRRNPNVGLCPRCNRVRKLRRLADDFRACADCSRGEPDIYELARGGRGWVREALRERAKKEGS